VTAPTYFHGRTGRKKLGGRKEICPTFSDCARVFKKKFPEKLSKIVVDGEGKSDYEKFLLDSIFPTKLTEFPTKLTEFVPFIFIISEYCPTVKRILPDRLCLPNKLGGLPCTSFYILHLPIYVLCPRYSEWCWPCNGNHGYYQTTRS
jgi:hypothetical protein